MGGQNPSKLPPIRNLEKSKPRFLLRASLIILVLTVLLSSREVKAADSFSLLAVSGGITGTLSGTDYINTFGTMNALGIGTPQTGLTVAALSNGALYFSEFQVEFSGMPANHKGALSAYVSTNFAHPAAQIVYMCPNSAGCTASGGYSALPTSVPVSPNVVVSPGVVNTTAVTVGIGVFLPDNDGASAFTGVDNGAVVTFNMYDLSSGTPTTSVASATWTFNGTPNQTVEDALELSLATASGGLTVTSNGVNSTPTYSMAFGTVNGLGIGPAAGLTTVAASNGTIYSTPYLLEPIFTDFSSTTATIKVYVSSNFARPTILILEEAAASGGPYTVISTTAGSPTVITTTAGDRSQITNFLGLFVSRNNSTTGTDSATLTYTMTVP